MSRLVNRFNGQAAAYVGGALLFVGAISTYWDIATHIDIGRERFITPAHLGIYLSVLLSAIAVALSGLADHFRAGDSFWAAVRHPFRHLRPGIGVAGAGLLTTLVAAPFDNLWHEIYGVDVTIWSPPHLLAIFGIASASLGLAVLVAPAVSDRTAFVYPLLLAAFLAALVMTLGEYDFNAPQYRIAFHPLLLGGIAAFVFTAAAGYRWRATQVAVWYLFVRFLAVLFLMAMDRSLTFVPLLIPAALVADLASRRRMGGALTGSLVAAVLVLTNWLLLETLPGLRWPVDDLALGGPAALMVGAAAGWLGQRLGLLLNGAESHHLVRTPGRFATVALLAMSLALISVPASAHEVGGARGQGTISWQPAVPEAGGSLEVDIEDLRLTSGATPSNLRIEAWRAEHRIEAPVNAGGEAKITLPERGLWFLFVRAEDGNEHLLWGDHLTVADEGEGVDKVQEQRFTLGLDTASGDEPSSWIDAMAYGLSLVILLLLVRGVVRALKRLPTVGAAPSGSK